MCRYPLRMSQEEPEGDMGDEGVEGSLREDSGLSSRRGSANRNRASVKVPLLCWVAPHADQPEALQQLR